MKKLSTDYRLKDEYLETYYKARAYLSLRQGYLEDVDPTIVEISDLLLQAQEDGVSVESIFGDDLIYFLKHLEAAFSSMPYYKSLYISHFAALLVSILFSLLSVSSASLIDLYGLTLILLVIQDGGLYALRGFIGRKIHVIKVSRIRLIHRVVKIMAWIIFFILITLQNRSLLPSLHLNVSMQVMLWMLGISFAPVIVVTGFQMHKEIKKSAITSKSSSEIQTSFKEEAIKYLEKKFIKMNLKREKKQLPPLSDQDVIKRLTREKKWVYIIYPPMLLGYLGFIGFFISIQIHEGIFGRLIILTVLLVLIMLMLSSVFMYWHKDISVLIYYLGRRNLQTFTPGAVPLGKLNKRYKVIESQQEALEK